MKKVFLAAAAAFLSLLIISCGSKKNELHIYNWADYMNPALIEKFEKEYNCKVVMNYFDSNEALYAKLKAGATGYDILFPTSYMSKLMFDRRCFSR